MIVMIFLTIVIFSVALYVATTRSYITTGGLLKEVFKVQNFSNIKTIYINNSLEIIRADKSGENYLFGVRKDYNDFTANNIHYLYEYAKKNHIHTIILTTYTQIGSESPIFRLIREYGIQVWDYNKLYNLAEKFDPSTENEYRDTILATSDTSNDTCPQDSSSDPIQDVHPQTNSIFSGLFSKPDRL